jgi:3-dehydroquinate synthase
MPHIQPAANQPCHGQHPAGAGNVRVDEPTFALILPGSSCLQPRAVESGPTTRKWPARHALSVLTALLFTPLQEAPTRQQAAQSAQVDVDLGDRSYPIYIGAGLLDQAELLQQHVRGRRTLIVTNETIAPLYLQR